MTKTQRAEIEKNLKPEQVAVDIQHKETGKDTQGFPVYEVVFENPPTNYKLVRLFEGINGAVLEDLDYVPTDGKQETTTN
jgi:hypothetical protein